MSRIDEAQSLVAGMQSDQERCMAVYCLVRTLLRSEQRHPVEWILAAANQIEDEVYRECAQRRLTWLMAHYGMEPQAWTAASSAVHCAARTLAGSPEPGFLRCLSETIDGLSPLVNYGSYQAVEFIHYALKTARRLGRHDAWAFISALYPLLAAVGGREVAEETWKQIQRVEDLRTGHGTIERLVAQPA